MSELVEQIIDHIEDGKTKDALVLLGFSGRGDKDLAALERFADVEPWPPS